MLIYDALYDQLSKIKNTCIIKPLRLEMARRVFITGFGPFANHPVNASSETLKKLSEDLVLEGIEFDFQELRVVYKSTKDFISSYWKTKSPLFCVHLGVYTEKFVSVECQCNETVYTLQDVEEKIPDDGKWPLIKSAFPLREIVQNLSQKSLPVPVRLSKDAGQYLCQYSFHNSLCNGNGNSVFVHVPKLEDSPAENTAVVVIAIIKELVKFLSGN